MSFWLTPKNKTCIKYTDSTFLTHRISTRQFLIGVFEHQLHRSLAIPFSQRIVEIILVRNFIHELKKNKASRYIWAGEMRSDTKTYLFSTIDSTTFKHFSSRIMLMNVKNSSPQVQLQLQFGRFSSQRKHPEVIGQYHTWWPWSLLSLQVTSEQQRPMSVSMA